MKRKNIINHIMKTASLLVTVMAFALSTPMAAHAKTTDNGSSNHHEISQDHSDKSHDMPAIDMISPDETNSTHGHNGVECCDTGMCISAALVENYNFSEAGQVRTNIALPFNKMTSAGKSRLMRPPSL